MLEVNVEELVGVLTNQLIEATVAAGENMDPDMVLAVRSDRRQWWLDTMCFHTKAHVFCQGLSTLVPNHYPYAISLWLVLVCALVTNPPQLNSPRKTNRNKALAISRQLHGPRMFLLVDRNPLCAKNPVPSSWRHKGHP